MRTRMLIVGAGAMTVPAIEVAKAMGLETIVFDGNPQQPGMKLADHAHVVSTKDPDGAVARARALAAESPIHGVVTCGADVEVTVAAIAEALGLPGASLRSARICNHKGLTRRTLAAANVPGPRFAEARTHEEAVRAADHVGYPLMVKPMDNCGSRGVMRVDDAGALADAFAAAKAFSTEGSVLLEQFVEGTTHTVEMIAHRGEYHLGSIIDTHHGHAPWAVELRHVNPSERSADDQRTMLEVAVAAARAAGITDGPAKVDFLFDRQGPKVMEMTARLSGGWHCQYTTPLALGTNNIRAALDVALGRAPREEDLVPRHRRFAVSEALLPPPGKVVAIRGLEAARALPGVAAVHALAQVGDVLPPLRSSADRRFFIIASGDTREERDAVVRRALDLIEVVTEPCAP